MSAALTLMAKDRGSPNIRLQVLLIPATDTNFETESYRSLNDPLRDEGEALCTQTHGGWRRGDGHPL
jgi:acetyl esterase/lipase